MLFRLVSALIVAIPFVMGAAPAGAGVSVASDGTVVTVTGYRAGGENHPQWSPSGPSGSAMDCRELISATNGLVDGDGAGAGLSWPPVDPTRQALWRYWLDCRYTSGPLAGTAVPLGSSGLGFVYADEIVDVDAIVRSFAEDYLGRTVAPDVGIGTSPPSGLVGVQQWFWIEGYDGSEVVAVHDVIGRRVEVRLNLSEVRWAFGADPLVVNGVAGLGKADGPSTVIHRFRDRSTGPANAAAALPITAEVVFAVRYTLDGAGPFEVEPPLTVQQTRSLVVREAQAVVHR
ncbi:MAG: hypothetical protein ACKV2O_04655 [Acidimicrobiales bacterium]